MHHCREVNECEKVLEEKPKCSRSSVRTMGMKKNLLIYDREAHHEQRASLLVLFE